MPDGRSAAEVVLTVLHAGRPDVHGGSLADRFKTFEDLDLVGAVVVN
jgi:hypothetical protein